MCWLQTPGVGGWYGGSAQRGMEKRGIAGLVVALQQSAAVATHVQMAGSLTIAAVAENVDAVVVRPADVDAAVDLAVCEVQQQRVTQQQ